MSTTLAAPVPAPTPAAPTGVTTVADLIDQLGGISPSRILMRPAPGTATEQDAIEAEAKLGRLCELVDGVLVEKAMGFRESLLAAFIVELLGRFVRERRLGLVTTTDGMMRLMPGLIRIPDVAFISWPRIPGGRVPVQAAPPFGPDLAIEVLSESSTVAEMARKRGEYFRVGGRLVWQVDPDRRTVEVFDAPDRSVVFRSGDSLGGGDVLPGFVLPLADLFAVLDQESPE